MNKGGERYRRSLEKRSRDYVKRAAPKKYQDILVPDWEIACKVCGPKFSSESMFVTNCVGGALLLAPDIRHE